MKLGKLDYVSDPRTLMLSEFVKPDISLPSAYDTDQYRRNFPNESWGSNEYKDCVLAARANAQLRLERIEQRRTLPITDEIVIDFYKKLTGCKMPGDKKDTGLSILPVLKQWKKAGWEIGERNYKIWAFGELEPQDHRQLMFGCYLLTGVHFGFALPKAIENVLDWNYSGQTTPEWKAGSLGGHCAFGHAYSTRGFTVMTGGRICQVNWEFIDKFCDEAWSVISYHDSWRIKQTFDVAKLEEALHNISQSATQ